MATSKDLLEKVFNHLDTLDVTTMDMGDLKDFLEVVQKGQFLESYGSIPACTTGVYNSYVSFVGGSGDSDVHTECNESSTGE